MLARVKSAVGVRTLSSKVHQYPPEIQLYLGQIFRNLLEEVGSFSGQTFQNLLEEVGFSSGQIFQNLLPWEVGFERLGFEVDSDQIFQNLLEVGFERPGFEVDLGQIFQNLLEEVGFERLGFEVKLQLGEEVYCTLEEVCHT